MSNTKTVRALVVGPNPSFIGEGTAGHLVPAGTQVILTVECYGKDQEDDNGNVIHRAGEPMLGANLSLIEEVTDGTAATTLPVGLPVGAVPAGPGVWLVPVGNGLTYEPWQPGDPSTNLSRQPPEAFAANRDDEPSLAEVRHLNDPNGVLDNGEPSTLSEASAPGGYKKRAELIAELEAKSIPYETDDNRDALIKRLADAK